VRSVEPETIYGYVKECIFTTGSRIMTERKADSLNQGRNEREW